MVFRAMGLRQLQVSRLVKRIGETILQFVRHADSANLSAIGHQEHHFKTIRT